MRRSARLVLCALLVFVGCDMEPPGPPVLPPSGPGLVTRPEAGAATSLVLVLPAEKTRFSEIWAMFGRQEAAKAKALLQVVRPEPGEPAARQAELIREATTRASALIVFAADPTAVAPAISEVQGEGVPVVLLERPVKVAGPAPTLVTFAPVETAAKRLVAAVVEAARARGVSPTGPALIVAREPGDEWSRRRVEALQSALRQAGVESLPVATFTGYIPEAQGVIESTLKEHPRLPIVLTEENQGLSAAFSAGHDRSDDPPYVMAGFTEEPRSVALAGYETCVAVADLNAQGLIRHAIQVALDRVAGEALPERIEVPIPVKTGTIRAKRMGRPTSRTTLP